MENNKILIINTSFIGDIISSLSVIKLLSQYFDVHFYTLESFNHLLFGENHIKIITENELSTFEYQYVLDFTSSKDSRKILKKVKKYNKSIGQYKGGLFTYFRKRIQYSIVVKKKKYNNIVKDFYTMLEPFDFIDITKIENYPKLTRTNKFDFDKNIITIHVGARNPIRTIPLKMQYEIIEFLHENFSNKIYVVGDEEKTIENLLEKYKFLNYIKTDLAMLKELIQNSSLFIGPDSGLLHIASALDVNSIAIYGPNLPSISGPLNKKVTFVEQDLECRPCNQNLLCKNDIKCLNNLDMDLLLKQIRKRLINE